MCHRAEFSIRTSNGIYHWKLFTEARDRIVRLQHFFGRTPWSFSIGFHLSVGQLKGRSKEYRSVALPPFCSFFDVPYLCSSSSCVTYSPNFCIIVLLLVACSQNPKSLNFPVFVPYFKYDISSYLWCDIPSSLLFFLTKCSS